MPTYEYHCPACKATYELRQGFSAETTHTCEECGKGTAKRVLYAPPVVFKGSGWYVTDSRSKNAAAAPDSKSDETTPATPAAASTDTATTPAPTPAPAPAAAPSSSDSAAAS